MRSRVKQILFMIGVSVLMTCLMFHLLQPVEVATVVIDPNVVVVDKEDNGKTSIVQNLPELEILALSEANYDVHVFYYPWYGNPTTDGKYIHWNHRYLPKNPNDTITTRHKPPEDIGSSFYPLLGPYSSRNKATVDYHMKKIREAGIGVLAVSWYPPGMHDGEGEFSDSVLPLLLNEAQKFNLKICLHVEPYEGRNEAKLRENLEYVVSTYGSHPAFYRRWKGDRSLPLYYIYDSYLVKPDAWRKLLRPKNDSGNISVRGTELDGIFVGLLVDKKDVASLSEGGFDGFYTYFGADGFTYGSTVDNWQELSRTQAESGMTFVPSVAPGYLDVRVRRWNGVNFRDRRNGEYYETAFEKAIDSGASMISITSFNEWHEGTQIEEAKPMSYDGFKYLDYHPHDPSFYLKMTKRWVDYFVESRHKRTATTSERQ